MSLSGTPLHASEFSEMKKKQTLLIVTEHPPKSYRPSGERMLHTALASSSAFGGTIVLSLRGLNKPEQQEEAQPRRPSETFLYAVRFVRGMLYPLAALFDPVKFLVFLVHGFRLVKRYKPSCILASMPPLETGMSAWLLSKYSGSSLVVDLRDDWESAISTDFEGYFPRIVFSIVSTFARNVYSHAVAIFAATQTIADTLRRRGVATPTLLVSNGADTSVFLPQDEILRMKIRTEYCLPLDKALVVYCGSGTIPYYRLDVVISCLKSLSQEEKDRIFVVFYVYDGLKRLKMKKRELGITDKVLEIRDPLPRRSLARVLAACDVGLLPFDDSAYLLCARSTKLYEYLSSGLYVISSGPTGGELEAFFSDHPALGSFIRPRSSDFTRLLSGISRTSEDLFGCDMRKLRHQFIKKNYDRKAIMRKAMKVLSDRTKCLKPYCSNG